MKNEKYVYAVLGALAGGVLTFVYMTSQWRSVDYGFMPMMGWGRGSTRSSMSATIDKHFIEQMIPHHDGAIEMAELAKERSQRPEILTLADNIIESQTAEIEQMRSWYREWYGEEVPVDEEAWMGMGGGMMHGGMMGGSVDIADLQEAEDFDTAMLKEMIPHHKMAIMMAQMLRSATERPEMVQLAENIIQAQEAEIEQMRRWLSEWGE